MDIASILAASKREATAKTANSDLNPMFLARTMSQANPPPASNGFVEQRSGVVAENQKQQPVETLPRRFRSAFILYSAVRHKEVREQLGKPGKSEKTANIAKIISRDWRTMEPKEKEIWLEKAREDKVRYEVEMAKYKASAKTNSRGSPDVLPPRRPMSAYLAFSNERRGATRRLHPKANNKELSQILAQAWKEADPEVKSKYIEEEARLRAKYNTDMIPFRNKKSKAKKAVMAAKKAETKGTPSGPVVPTQPQIPPSLDQIRGTPTHLREEARRGLDNNLLAGHFLQADAAARQSLLNARVSQLAASQMTQNLPSYLDALRASSTENYLLQLQQEASRRQLESFVAASTLQQQPALVDQVLAARLAQRNAQELSSLGHLGLHQTSPSPSWPAGIGNLNDTSLTQALRRTSDPRSSEDFMASTSFRLQAALQHGNVLQQQQPSQAQLAAAARDAEDGNFPANILRWARSRGA